MVDFSKILNIFPDIFPRDPDSTLYQYTEAHQDETDTFGEKLDEVQNSHFIDHASDEDLDRIGAMFGPLGERAGRSDQEYRAYLKTIVQAYRGAGTVPAIKKAVAAGLGVHEDDVIIEEDYANLRYRIRLKEWSDHKGSTIEELADLADASVSTHQRTHYVIDTEEAEFGDSISITEGHQIEDLLTADDPMDFSLSDDYSDPTAVLEKSVLDDTIRFDPSDEYSHNTNFLEELTFGVSIRFDASDEYTHNTNFLEESVLDDPVDVNPDKTSVKDDDTSDDTVEVNPNKTEVTDADQSDDPIEVNPNKTSVSDEANTGDAATVNPGKTAVSDGLSGADSVSTASRKVVWDSGNWGTMRWE